MILSSNFIYTILCQYINKAYIKYNRFRLLEIASAGVRNPEIFRGIMTMPRKPASKSMCRL